MLFITLINHHPYHIFADIGTRMLEYHDDVGELKRQLARVGVPGRWASSDSMLMFKTESTDPKDSASMYFNKDANTVQFHGDSTFKERFFRASIHYKDPMANLRRMDLPDRIIENLYLGSHDSALNMQALKDRNITHIISAGRDLKRQFPEDFKYNYVDLSEEDNMFPHFQNCVEFISEGRSQGAVLIHCAEGVSRSELMTIAYLMYACNHSHGEARKLVHLKRRINPNMSRGFVSDLIKWDTILMDKQKSLMKAKKLEVAKKLYIMYA